MAVLGSGKVEIDTYGELKTLIAAITTKQKGLKIKGIVIDTIVDELVGKLPGGPTAKKTLDFVKAAFGKPDSVKTNTWLDRLDVDDQLSAIVDDTVENKFLQDISKRIEGQSDNTPLRQDFNMNTELVDFLKTNYKGRTVVGPQNEIKKMKKTNIRSILKEVVTSTPIEEAADFNTGVRIKELESFLSKWLIPVLEKGVGRDLIKAGFTDMLVKEINDRLNSPQEVGESALSPGYVTNVYSDHETLEATIYKDGGVSINVRSGGRSLIHTAAISVTDLSNEEFENYLVDLLAGQGFQLDDDLQIEISNFVKEVKLRVDGKAT